MSDYLPSTSACRLPEELMTDILFRLPVKTLAKFQLVSPSWFSLIKNPIFTKMHMDHQVDNDCLIIVRRDLETNMTDIYTYSHDTNVCKPIGVPHFGRAKGVGCCNGVLCLTLDQESTWFGFRFLLYNPAIADFKHVFEDESTYGVGEQKRVSISLGFGFDSRANDIKIVRLQQFEDINAIQQFEHMNATKCDVYSRNRDSWRSFQSAIYGRLVETMSDANVNGAIHWLANWGRNETFIVSFDISNEVLGELMLPERKRYRNGHPYMLPHWKIHAWKDRLAAIVSYHSGQGRAFDLWSMTEYGVWESWVRVEEHRDILASRWNDHKFISYDIDTLKLSSYDPYKQERKEIKDPKFYENTFEVFKYKETLIAVDGSRRFEFRSNTELAGCTWKNNVGFGLVILCFMWMVGHLCDFPLYLPIIMIVWLVCFLLVLAWVLKILVYHFRKPGEGQSDISCVNHLIVADGKSSRSEFRPDLELTGWTWKNFGCVLVILLVMWILGHWWPPKFLIESSWYWMYQAVRDIVYIVGIMYGVPWLMKVTT